MRDRWLLVLLLYTAALLAVSSTPGAVIAEAGLSSLDIAYHFCSYLVLGLIATRAFGVLGRAALYGAVLAVVDEMHQHIIPGRAVSALDLALNMAGLTAGILMYYLINRWMERDGIPRNGGPHV